MTESSRWLTEDFLTPTDDETIIKHISDQIDINEDIIREILNLRDGFNMVGYITRFLSYRENTRGSTLREQLNEYDMYLRKSA